MIEIAGYLCLAAAAAAFFVAGAVNARQLRRGLGLVSVLIGAGLLGLAGAWLGPEAVVLIAFSPVALPLGMAWSMSRLNTANNTDGERYGS
jgi:hypothetical protein